MIQFTIPGIPVGKGRPKFSTINGHAVAYTPAKTASYENLVKLAYQQQCTTQAFEKDAPLKAEIVAYFPVPKSTSKKKREEMLCGKIRHTKKPDTDNIAKAILDALNGIAYHDDSQIFNLTVRKRYAESPRAEVTIVRCIPCRDND